MCGTKPESSLADDFTSLWFGEKMRKVLILISSLLLAAFAAFIVSMVGAVASRESKSFFWKTMEQSQRITAALRKYADAEGGKLPATLDELVARNLMAPEDLLIDLMNGEPAVSWIYFSKPEVDTRYKLVLISPPLSNDAGDLIRGARVLAGRPQLPQRNELWVFGWLDGSAEAIPRSKLRYMAQFNGIEPSQVPGAKSEELRQ